MKLSKRLFAVAGLVTEGVSVADVGTDHGYVPIYLVENGICPKAVAMDIHRGPLKRAGEHVRECGLEERIELRISDGLSALNVREAAGMIAAGMGGGLIIRILEKSPEIVGELEELILQPQSEIHKVRRYLNVHDFRIVKEDMVEEDGKFYPMMKARHGRDRQYAETELYYGPLLLQNRHPVLLRYLSREKKIRDELLRELRMCGGGRADLRAAELQKELERIRDALEFYFGE